MGQHRTTVVTDVHLCFFPFSLSSHLYLSFHVCPSLFHVCLSFFLLCLSLSLSLSSQCTIVVCCCVLLCVVVCVVVWLCVLLWWWLRMWLCVCAFLLVWH